MSCMMKRIPVAAAIFALAVLAGPASSPDKKPIPRRDAFFGLHFDLHPSKTDTALGADVTEENITKLLDRGTFQTLGLVTDVQPFLRDLLLEDFMLLLDSIEETAGVCG